MEDQVRVQRRAAVALLTLHRPEKANAYTPEMLATLAERLETCAGDESLRAVVLGGSGRHFCAGADLQRLKERTFRDGLELQASVVFDRLATLPQITLAALHGAVLGGGLELALACDLRLASTDLDVGLPELSHGILPAAGALRRLPRLIGEAQARAIILGGLRLHADQALALGLVSAIHPRTQLEARALEWAERVAGFDPVATRLAKAGLEAQADHPIARHAERVAQSLLYELAASRAKV